MLPPQRSSQGLVAENCSCSCDPKRVGQRGTDASLSLAQDHPAELQGAYAPIVQNYQMQDAPPKGRWEAWICLGQETVLQTSAGVTVKGSHPPEKAK